MKYTWQTVFINRFIDKKVSRNYYSGIINDIAIFANNMIKSTLASVYICV